jgi:antitoxin YefM
MNDLAASSSPLDSSVRSSILYVKEVAMQTTYRVHADELTDDFVQALKATYKNKEIEIVVSDVVNDTDYLLSTEANRDQLLGAIKDIESGENLSSFSLDDLPRP